MARDVVIHKRDHLIFQRIKLSDYVVCETVSESTTMKVGRRKGINPRGSTDWPRKSGSVLSPGFILWPLNFHTAIAFNLVSLS